MRRSGAGFGVLALAMGLAAPGSTEEPVQGVGLDRLLKLPPSVSTGVERKGGMTRGEWRARFERIEVQLASEQQSLAAAQKERDRVAHSSDQWLMGAPGMTNTEAPLDYRLRQEITRHKEEIDRLKSARDSLEVEANLAGVPEDWRRPPQ
jgi:hypothetical protein